MNGATSVSEKPGWAVFSAGTTLAATESRVGAAGTCFCSNRAEFSLSAKTIELPLLLRDHPSGTLAVNFPDGETKATYAWLSGMSPDGFTSVLLEDDEPVVVPELQPVRLSNTANPVTPATEMARERIRGDDMSPPIGRSGVDLHATSETDRYRYCAGKGTVKNGCE